MRPANQQAAGTSFIEVGGVRLPADFPVELRWVTARLAMGSMIGTVRNMEKLRAEGITHVLGLQAELDDRQLVGDTGIEVIYLPVANHPEPILPEPLAAAMQAGPAVLANEQARLFVHCLAGRHRAPTFTYAILRATGWSAAAAEERILATDPRAQLCAEALAAVDALVATSTQPSTSVARPS